MQIAAPGLKTIYHQVAGLAMTREGNPSLRTWWKRVCYFGL